MNKGFNRYLNNQKNQGVLCAKNRVFIDATFFKKKSQKLHLQQSNENCLILRFYKSLKHI